MGHDKAFIDYHGLAQYQWSSDLLGAYCNEVYISVSERLSSKILKPTIVDRWKEAGPLAAIISAHLAYPEQDFFLLPCDMPYLRFLWNDWKQSQSKPQSHQLESKHTKAGTRCHTVGASSGKHAQGLLSRGSSIQVLARTGGGCRFFFHV